jgi:hypothetical protein
MEREPIPMAAPLKDSICGRSLAGIAGGNSLGLMDVCFLRVLCDQVHASAKGRSLIQSPPECGVSECDVETSTTMRPRPTRAVEPWKKNNLKNKNLQTGF